MAEEAPCFLLFSLALHHQVQRAPALHTRGTETIHLHAAPPSTVQLHPACWWIFLVNFSSVPGGITVWEGIALITGCSKGLGWYTASTGFIVLWDKRNKSTFFFLNFKKAAQIVRTPRAQETLECKAANSWERKWNTNWQLRTQEILPK